MNNDATDEGQYYSSPATVLHDVLYVMGLGDRYYDTDTQQGAAPGYEKDIIPKCPLATIGKSEVNPSPKSVEPSASTHMQRHFNNGFVN